MPYVNNVLREVVDEKIDAVVHDILQHTKPEERDGLANYVVTRLVMGTLKPETGWNYVSLSNVIKTLECAKAEIYRRKVAPYEDGAIARNRDLAELSG